MFPIVGGVKVRIVFVILFTGIASATSDITSWVYEVARDAVI